MKAQLPKGIRTLQEGAKLLLKDGVQTSSKKIFAQLRQLHWLEGRMPAADAISNGLLVRAEGSFQYRSNSGGEEAYIRTGITDKGLAVLEEYFKGHSVADESNKLQEPLRGKVEKAREEADLFCDINGNVELGNGNKCELGC